jgi:glycosyltransferase involved in cell wall biosynthesis
VRLLVLPKYGRLGASSRLRSYQYLSSFQRVGIDVHVHSLLGDAYVRALYGKKRDLRSIVSGYMTRIGKLFSARSFDAVYMEKEALPWLPAMLELGALPAKMPLVVDYDDAIFHTYDQHRHGFVRHLLGDKLDKVMQRANLVTAGSRYLVERAQAAGSRHVEHVPTVVDLERYPLTPRAHDDALTIGWIGSPSTAHYLRLVSEPLEKLSRTRSIRCVAIGARADQLVGTPFSAVPWSEASEVASLQSLDIGIMPLPDEAWERGKCGYKLIQYMACGVPVLASPVGENRNIVHAGQNGFLASTPAEWAAHLEQLIDDAELRRRLGQAGRRRVEAEYCLQVQGPRLSSLILQLAASR